MKNCLFSNKKISLSCGGIREEYITGCILGLLVFNLRVVQYGEGDLVFLAIKNIQFKNI